MEPVQGVSISNAGSGRPVQLPSGVGSAPGAAGASGALVQAQSSTMIATSTTRVSQVYSQVDTMLGNLGLDMQNQEILRMIIALMLLEALLAQDGGSQQSGGVGLLADLAGRSESMSYLSIQSETNIVQVQQQSWALSSPQAVQSLGFSAGEGGQTGSELDTQA